MTPPTHSAIADHLREKRNSLLRRIKPGRAGVTSLRARLTEITHALLKLEA